jgi:hypothetical protein
MFSCLRFDPALERVVLASGGGASVVAGEGEHGHDSAKERGEYLPAGSLALRGFRVRAFMSRALGPPGLRPMARVRRVVGIAA